ncbi:MAG: F0F1 ATP synthase subunit epsilon [Syntrophorhabdus sp.]|jgi:F-type H+-transporting ATPase subunit epsilon
MNLKILLPTGILLYEEINKITAEAVNGLFCLLPRHIDFLAALAPGILSFVSVEGKEEFLAVDEGVLVKAGPEVLVSSTRAVRGGELGQLKETVERVFRKIDDQEKAARSTMAKLEADLVRGFMELGERGYK